MTTKRKLFRCYLRNVKVNLQHCGYGEGKTWEEAVSRALELGKQRDPNAYYEGGMVHFDGGPVHL